MYLEQQMGTVSLYLVVCLLVLGGQGEGKKQLSHPSLTGISTISLKVLYW